MFKIMKPMRNSAFFVLFLNIGLVFAMSTERNGKLTPSLFPHLQICSGQWHLSSSPLEKNFEGDLSSAAFTELTASFVLARSRTSVDRDGQQF